MRMTQVWDGDKVVPVTPITAGPCFVVQVKNEAKDGYVAWQVGFGVKKEKNIKKPQLNHIAKSGQKNLRYLKEFRANDLPEAKPGDVITLATFAKGEDVSVTAESKGKGFQGVVKRHGFHGFRKTHGNKDQERHSGSVGAKGPAHVFKGTKMGGHMGAEQVTTKNLEIISIDETNNIIYVKGSVPGAIDSLVVVKGTGELKFAVPAEATVEAEVVADIVEEAKEETPAPEVKTEEVAVNNNEPFDSAQGEK